VTLIERSESVGHSWLSWPFSFVESNHRMERAIKNVVVTTPIHPDLFVSQPLTLMFDDCQPSVLRLSSFYTT